MKHDELVEFVKFECPPPAWT